MKTPTFEAQQGAGVGCYLTPCSASWLENLGGFQITINGQELKGWTPDFEEGGAHMCSLDANDCREVAAAFLEVAQILEQNETSPSAPK